MVIDILQTWTEHARLKQTQPYFFFFAHSLATDSTFLIIIELLGNKIGVGAYHAGFRCMTKTCDVPGIL